MIVTIGCHGIRTTFICASQQVFNFGFTLWENGSKSVSTWINGKLDQCNVSIFHCVSMFFSTDFQLDFVLIFVHRKSELIALLCASLLGMPGGCLLFIPFYHPLHDSYKVPSEVTSVSILMVFTAIVWRFDRKSNRYQRPAKMNLISKMLFGHLIVHYLINLGTAIFFNPEDVISIGLHQQIGNCNDTQPVHTILTVFFFHKFIRIFILE